MASKKKDDTEASIQKQLDLAQRLMQQQQHPHQPQASKPRALPTSAQHSRKVQDSKRAEHDTFHSAIVNLKLDPVDGSQPAKQSQEEKELPSSFESHQKYVQLFSPLVLEEIRAELQAARAEAEEARVGELTDLSAPEELFQFFTLQIPVNHAAAHRGRDAGRDFESQDCVAVALTKFRWTPAPKVISPRASSSSSSRPPGAKPHSPRGGGGGAGAGGDAKGEWTPTGQGMEVLALVAGVSYNEVNKQRVAAVRLKCRANLDLASKTKGWRDATARSRLQFKVTKLKNIGVSVREWRSIRAIEANPMLGPQVLNPSRAAPTVEVEERLATPLPPKRGRTARTSSLASPSFRAHLGPGKRQ